MKKQTANDFDLKNLTPELIRQIFLWAPIVIGLVHQFLMYFFDIDSIYVFVPPGYIHPWVSLEYEWWLVLLLGTSVVCLAAYSSRFHAIPNRVAIPTYLYILFLLILVKPV